MPESARKIRIRNGPYAGRERTLGEVPTTIGRDMEATLQILDRSASRFHAEVFPVGGMYFAKDLSSKNGTYINDSRLVDEELLREGDVIKIGNTEIIFESGAATADDSSERLAFQDDMILANTIEFRIDDLSDLQDQDVQKPASSLSPSGVARESRQLQLLYQFGKLLGKNQGRDAVSTALDSLIKSLPAECAVVFLREGRSGKLVPQTVRLSKPGHSPVISRTIIRRTVTENRAFFTANAQEDQRVGRTDSVHGRIQSVVCVPLSISGITQGVVYLARSTGSAPFTQADMELVSACAVQLGVHLKGSEALVRQQQKMDVVIRVLLRPIEEHLGLVGSGERTSRFATALAQALRLSAQTVQDLQLAGLLHHLERLCPPTSPMPSELLQALGQCDGFESLIGLIEACQERLDGTGPRGLREDDLDTEMRILSLAAAFEAATRDHPDRDAMAVIDDLIASPGFDPEMTAVLKTCHLDGSLYQSG